MALHGGGVALPGERLNLRLLVVASLFAAAFVGAVAPASSAAGACTSVTRDNCAGTVCVSSSPSTTVPENCNILYVPHLLA